ncbi:FKBP-type peptidyl-prolyl cis-trans isomerase [Catalinimonas alkaloidigena]|uniref:FKBP-type peptidyl-prolyl cis-trans isomerase n=1 Tax=Catalinimonas alkaloidigena TaxID=1075417 RepID=UPI00159F8213|nr:FKBP-type peptidyl-prolyl cis-trans isomerase [Catalinimonas alkaloidigena]
MALSLLASCKGERKGTTTSGLEYTFHKDEEGEPADTGDILTLHFRLANSRDSVLRDTHNDPAPLQIPLQPPSFPGSLEEGLFMMSPGDSATFYVQADSLFAFQGMPRPDFIDSNSRLAYTVSLIKVQTAEEAQAEMQAEQEEQMAEMNRQREEHIPIDDSLVSDYIAKNNLNAQMTESGLAYVIEKAGSGAQPQAGDTVQVNYELKTLNGDKIDSSYDRGRPFSFTLGQGQVIPGWDEGIGLLKEGSKAKLIVPSRLAYNERPLGNLAPPFSVLVFDVELLKVNP